MPSLGDALTSDLGTELRAIVAGTQGPSTQGLLDGEAALSKKRGPE